MLEAAVSSAICHPNIVQTYDYQVVDTYQSATLLRTEANRVRHTQRSCSLSSQYTEALESHSSFC